MLTPAVFPIKTKNKKTLKHTCKHLEWWMHAIHVKCQVNCVGCFCHGKKQKQKHPPTYNHKTRKLGRLTNHNTVSLPEEEMQLKQNGTCKRKTWLLAKNVIKDEMNCTSLRMTLPLFIYFLFVFCLALFYQLYYSWCYFKFTDHRGNRKKVVVVTGF